MYSASAVICASPNILLSAENTRSAAAELGVNDPTTRIALDLYGICTNLHANLRLRVQISAYKYPARHIQIYTWANPVGAETETETENMVENRRDGQC